VDLNIFTEAFMTRLLPLFNEVTLGATRHFQPEHYPLNALLAAAGALTASVLLFLFGIWLRRMPDRVSTDAQKNRIKKMQIAAGSWLPWLLILSASPIGGALIMAAGFFRMRPAVAAAAIIAAEVLWRISPLINAN
jgi:membrane protein YqaA with SNARE-associated domain